LSKAITKATNGAAPSGNTRMAGEDRRLQLLAIAVSLFSERGFGGTTTKEIAQAAGVSEAMVFRHFATKEELYAAILDHKACSGESFEPAEMAADGIRRKDDRAVFESLALGALRHHEKDPDFQRLLLHSALEKHELAQMFFDQFVRRVYEFLGSYIRERQKDGALIEIDPAIVVRCFIGMVMHHSLNNNLWDPKRRLLNISNENAAKHFTNILLNGISATPLKATNRRSSSAKTGSRNN
jgi:TetR/AcrR family transcriptional regulator